MNMNDLLQFFANDPKGTAGLLVCLVVAIVGIVLICREKRNSWTSRKSEAEKRGLRELDQRRRSELPPGRH